MYTKEVFPDYSYLKLGMVWPLPKKMIADFFKKVKKVIVVEELDPFLETEIKALGYKIFHGKDVIPTMYELSPEIVEKSLSRKEVPRPEDQGEAGRPAEKTAEHVSRLLPQGALLLAQEDSAPSSSAT